MQTLAILMGTVLVFSVFAMILVVLDYKFTVPLFAWFLPKDQRPDPDKRKGIVARRSAQTQCWVAAVLALFSVWLSPSGQDLFTGFLVFSVRALCLWVVFLYAGHIVRGWDNRKDFFKTVESVAGGDTTVLGEAVQKGSETIAGLRGKTLSRMDRIRNWVASFLAGAQKLRADYEEVRAESVSAPTVPTVVTPPSAPAAPPQVDPREGIGSFLGGGSKPAPKSPEGEES